MYHLVVRLSHFRHEVSQLDVTGIHLLGVSHLLPISSPDLSLQLPLPVLRLYQLLTLLLNVLLHAGLQETLETRENERLMKAKEVKLYPFVIFCYSLRVAGRLLRS